MKKFLAGFVKRDGLAVLLSTFLIKISGIILSVAIVRLLSVKQYGDIAFAVSITGIVSIFAGLGSNWSLLRFGPELQSLSARFQLLKHALIKGTLYSLPMILLVILASFMLPANLKGSKFFLIILSFSILTNFLYQALQSYFRIIGKNKLYSKSNVLGSIILLVMAVVLSLMFEGYGYVIALVLAPLFAYAAFYKHLRFQNYSSEVKTNKRFFTYGIYTSLGMIASQATISLGPVIGGYLNATSTDLAQFRVATIIPFNMLVLPLLIMTTDFVHFSKNARNSVVLKDYYVQYLKTVSLLMLIPFLIILVFNKTILLILFGDNYMASAQMSMVLLIGVLFSFFFRIPLGNMLAAVGKADWNVVHTIFWLIAFIPISILSYSVWGMLGIAASISFVFIFSGFISLFLFFYYLKIIEGKKLEPNQSSV